MYASFSPGLSSMVFGGKHIFSVQEIDLRCWYDDMGEFCYGHNT